ncbi:unnamed protein product [Urochloa decumbens]|uniref:non-specific serine/threonine protein kinase n=1 Tax=Urochloa decumbens TaxID=240449 RepID=A0ABC8VDX4_9POAL
MITTSNNSSSNISSKFLQANKLIRQSVQETISIYMLGLLLFILLSRPGGVASSLDDGQQFAYHGFAGANLTLDGLAAVLPGGLLALTNFTQQTKAHAFHPAPIHFLISNKSPAATARSFSTSFVFAIVSGYDGLSDHGLAFVVAPTTDFSAANAGQYLGLLNATNATAGSPILAVELDTILTPEFRDINSNHVGIDVNSLVSSQAKPAGYYADDDAGGAFRNLSLNSREPMQVWVDYDGASRTLDVTLAPVHVPKPRTPLLSEAIDLSELMAADAMYVGFSASSGVVSTHHYVLGWSFAVDGFRDRNLLGVGGFGRVYKGVLSEPNLEIAVKRVSHDSRQGVREFVAEVVSIGRLRHRNLVQLLGYCRRRDDELLLVYDYMPNGSLEKHLHDPHTPAILSWPQRHSIIKGVASGLLYLHEDWDKVVLHRDIKPSNVLLDEQMSGHLGDFGLAKLHDHGTDAQTTHVVGTMGYLAPELVRTGKATPLTDVFAFGVFLLEVACGRRPIQHGDHNSRVVLVDWVLEHHRGGSILEAVDPRLAGKFDMEEAALVLRLGLLCSHPLPDARPGMRKVVQYLERGQPAPDLPPAYVSYGKARARSWMDI